MAVSKSLPPVSLVRRNETHRLIASKHGQSVLNRIADSSRHLNDIFKLDIATNERTLVEGGIPGGIDVHELVFGLPYAQMVNASFTHPHPLGSRFNGPDRGAWYCGFEIETSIAEIAFHKTLDLLEIGVLHDDVTFDDFTADFSAEFADLREGKRFAAYLDPKSYVASQQLAEKLLQAGSLGIVYPSVRHAGGTCIACFRPALVMNVAKGATYRFRWDGEAAPSVSVANGTRRG
ncbi:MAG: RES family NAD+ phosphorylase [Candidatus Eremiobacteraeota bacterium]|nr:RES family NAD+ phosphorylase [Candidatus Eremiobacteraeota bacterium]